MPREDACDKERCGCCWKNNSGSIAAVRSIRGIKQAICLSLGFHVSFDSHVREDIIRRNPLMPQGYDGKRIDCRISARVLSIGEILGMGCFVKRDRGQIAIEVNCRRIRIEVIASEEPAWHDSFRSGCNGTKRVTPWPRYGFVSNQSTPIVERSVLIQSHFHVQ